MKQKSPLLIITALLGVTIAASFAGDPLAKTKAEKPAATAAYGSTQPKMNGKLIVGTLAPEDIRYTGKPYIKELGAYVFNYRNYDPQISRWTTPDPSGFPDGANQNYYAPSPTFQLDREGLLKMNTLVATGRQWNPTLQGFKATYDEYTVTANDGSTKLNLYKYLGGVPTPFASNWSYNCAGYVFANADYWINPGAAFSTPSFEAILKAEGYKKIQQAPYNDAAIALWGAEHLAKVTNNNGDDVTEVTGKKGGELNLTISTPAEQWAGNPTYWE